MTMVTASAAHQTPDAVPIERLADGSIRFELKSGFLSRQIVTLTPVELLVRSEGLFRSSEHRFAVDVVTGFGFRRIKGDEGPDRTGIAFDAGGQTHFLGYNLDRMQVAALVDEMTMVAPQLVTPRRDRWKSLSSRVKIVSYCDGANIDISRVCNLSEISFFCLFVSVCLLFVHRDLQNQPLWDFGFFILVGAFVFLAGSLASFLWSIGQSRRLKLCQDAFEVTSIWMGIPFRRRTVRVQDITRIELLPNSDADGLVSAIALDAQAQNMGFGRDLSLIEANGIIDEMVKIAPELGQVVVTRNLQVSEAYEGPKQR